MRLSGQRKRHGCGLCLEPCALLPLLRDLFGLCHPAAISRRIIADVHIAAKSRTVRTWPNIREEGFKTVAPSFADFNSRTAVAAVPLGIRILATLEHRGPCGELGANLASPTVAMRQVKFLSETAARSRFAVPKIARANPHVITANAEALPHDFSATAVTIALDHLQASESPTFHSDKMSCAKLFIPFRGNFGAITTTTRSSPSLEIGINYDCCVAAFAATLPLHVAALGSSGAPNDGQASEYPFRQILNSATHGTPIWKVD